MNRSVLAASALVLAAPFATAQWRALPGSPMVSPPAPHPALAAQPLAGGAGGGDGGTRAAPGSRSPAAAMPAQPPRDPDTFGPKLEGKALKQAVARVKKLAWHESLLDARAMSAATGKPVLWLQALGEIDGFA